MGKPTKTWVELGDYLFKTLKWGDNAVPVMLLCHDDDEIAKELFDLAKNNPKITHDELGDKAVELRERKQ